ncbi:MCP methyltransferase, CheR-type [Methanobacterium lacus]|uniref:protein-glutamate O-methyltransferase n=1 Tax=Methanobacterium lacus (strain AL-21) TaxID=877455 RepID=F0TCV7_METLA|nr:protein-glutamate O-methyltransferase CheR [Methanobacterium lacus]ADZ10497.1 MCP methyltransferase, CheR-type [Methanobacterium lacus]
MTVPKVIAHQEKTAQILNKIFILIQNKTGHDFSAYKKSTINRRIQKRMKTCQVDEICDYLEYLHENPDEIHLLYNELLINVTQFFRDPEAYESLKSKFFINILEAKDDDVIRIWVPGCSSGEEVYSIAIMISELFEEMNQNFKVQIFGTDIDESVIRKARSGKYKISSNIHYDRLCKYFYKNGDEYTIKNEIREMMIFSTHNVITDPPFTRLDMISCRNLLIYLESSAQQQVISNFVNALNKDGILFLGPSENIGKFLDTFKIEDNKWNIFRGANSGRMRLNLKTNFLTQ